jgi:hypothetical protein
MPLADVLSAVLVPDVRIGTASLDAGESDYTEAGPTAPGAVTLGADTVVGLSGEQAASIYLSVGRGGDPDPARGARLRWADSSTDTLLGWAPPTWVRHTTGTADLTESDITDAIALQSGLLMVASASGSAGVEVATYDPADDTWTARADLPYFATVATPDEALLALWQDPGDGTVYALQTHMALPAPTRRVLVASTDEGNTWAEVAQCSFTGGTIVQAGRKCRWWRLPSGVHVLIVMSATVLQLWTSTSGEDWRFGGELTGIEDGASGQVPTADVQLTPDGRLIWAYALSASKETLRVRITDPVQDPATAAVIDLATTSGFTVSVGIAVEETGRAWIFAEEASSGTRVYRSINYTGWSQDNGGRLFVDGDMAQREPRRIVPLWGGHALVSASYTGVSSSEVPMVYLLGGWGSIEPWSSAAAASAQDSARMTWGASDTAAVPWQGLTCNQFKATPASFGWTLSTGSTNSETASIEDREISTTSGTRTYDVATEGDSVLAFFDLAVDSGGNTTAGIGWEVSVDLGSSTYIAVRLAVSTTGYRLHWGSAGPATSPTSLDMTERTQWMVCIEAENRVEVYHKRPYERAWTSALQTSTPTTGGAVSARVLWGHGSVTGVSRWRSVMAVWSTATPSSTAERDPWRSTGSTAAARARVLGRPLSAYPGALGDPTTHPSATLLTLAPTGGIAATVPPLYLYGIDHIDPRRSPSPRERWRSTSTAEQSIVWDLGEAGADLRYLGLYLSGANFQTAYLEVATTSSYTTIATLDLGINVASYALSGSTVTPVSGNLRWLTQSESVGGVAVLDGDARTIVQQDAGYGTAALTAPRFRVELQGSESATGAAVLVLPRGVVAALSRTAARYVRLRIPASQPTPTGDYRIGVAAIGRVYLLGVPYTDGVSTAVSTDVRSSERPGYEIRTRRSPPRRTRTLIFASENVAGPESETGGGLAPSGALTLGAGLAGDLTELLTGLQHEGADTVPVLVMPAAPETTATETRERLLWWGHMAPPTWENVIGRIGDDTEDVLRRPGTITVTEQV